MPTGPPQTPNAGTRHAMPRKGACRLAKQLRAAAPEEYARIFELREERKPTANRLCYARGQEDERYAEEISELTEKVKQLDEDIAEKMQEATDSLRVAGQGAVAVAAKKGRTVRKALVAATRSIGEAMGEQEADLGTAAAALEVPAQPAQPLLVAELSHYLVAELSHY